MPRVAHSAYQLTFWAKMLGPSSATPEVTFMDVDENYDWVGGAPVALSGEWQHIAMQPVSTFPKHKNHEIGIAFLVGSVQAEYHFDDIQLMELDVPSPPPPAPPPPPNVLLWCDGEGGPNPKHGPWGSWPWAVVSEGKTGAMSWDLSSAAAAHEGTYGYELRVAQTFDKDWYAMLTLPPFLVTDHQRVYSLTFWAKASANPKPRPHIAFQDEDNDYAYIDGAYLQLSAIWHEYTVQLVVPRALRGHNVITNLLLGSYTGTYYFDEFKVSNAEHVQPPPLPPSPPPSPPPNVLLRFDAEAYEIGAVNSQAWAEGKMHVVPQSQLARHAGEYGLLIEVERPFEVDWHAQVSFRPFSPPDVHHGFVLSFWARASTEGGAAGGAPKLVFHDADDSYVTLKKAVVPLTEDWSMFQVDLALPPHRAGHRVVVAFWVGEARGTYCVDDVEVTMTLPFEPPPPSPPGSRRPPSPAPSPAPGVLQLLLFEAGDEDVSSETLAPNGTWAVSIPDARAAHEGAKGLYVEVTRPWGVAQLAQLLLPRYVPHADRETLLHIAFYAKVEKLRATDPDPSVTVAFVDLHQNDALIAIEEVPLTFDWQLHYVVIDLKREHVGHSIRPYLYLGRHAGIYAFDEIEYKEIPIEDGMEWIQSAPERIQAHRMASFELSFLDRDGWPIDYGAASVRLVRHDFPFGVSLQTRREAGLSSRDHQWLLRAAAAHFWTGTLQTQLQWSHYEPAPGQVQDARAATEELLRWAAENRWLPLSASLFDGGHSDAGHWSNNVACKELTAHLHERVLRDLRSFGGAFGRYEVWKDSLRWRDWVERCGESLMHSAYSWAAQAAPQAELCTSESGILSSLTLTPAEAYHNSLWDLRARGVPVQAIGVQAHFDGEVDASTVKHRLDVLRELRMPVYITELTISGLDPAQQAYELEKFLRIAFSHEAVAGITLGQLWDDPRTTAAGANGPGLYTAGKQPKPGAERVDSLWRGEWHTEVTHEMTSRGREAGLLPLEAAVPSTCVYEGCGTSTTRPRRVP